MPDEKQNPQDIDRIIHEPARLLILAHLYIVEKADFTYLLHQTELTYGNLSSHMSKLEQAGYIEVEKAFKDKRPNTMLKLTESGRNAFQKYRQQMLDMLGSIPE